LEQRTTCLARFLALRGAQVEAGGRSRFGGGPGRVVPQTGERQSDSRALMPGGPAERLRGWL